MQSSLSQNKMLDCMTTMFFNYLKIIINIGTLSVQELSFPLIGLLGVRLGVSPVGMVELSVHGASLTT